jgi:hypothetical protein
VSEMIKRTYSLPSAVLTAFEGEVKSEKRSAVVAELIQDRLYQFPINVRLTLSFLVLVVANSFAFRPTRSE